MNDNEILIKQANALNDLLASQQTLLLSSASKTGEPDISYAPFVCDETGCFYIFISELAAHTDNLLTNPKASVLFIRLETESHNLFARERAVFECTVREISRNEEIYSHQITALQDKFGEIVSLLKTLADFHLFALSPVNGRYVAGFGQAYVIDTQTRTLTPLVKKHGQTRRKN